MAKKVKNEPMVFTVLFGKGGKHYQKTYATRYAERPTEVVRNKVKIIETKSFCGCVKCDLCKKVSRPTGNFITTPNGIRIAETECEWVCMRDRTEWYTEDWDNFEFPACTCVNRRDGRNVYFVDTAILDAGFAAVCKSARLTRTLYDLEDEEAVCAGRSVEVKKKPQRNPKETPKKPQKHGTK